MQCEDFARMLDNYENLTEEEKIQMTAHTDVCPDCKKEFEFMQSIISVTKTLPRLSVPDNFLETLNERIDAEEVVTDKRSVIAHLKYNWQKYSAVVASLLLVAVIGTNGDMLVSRINGDESGVIVDTTITTSVPVEAGDKTPVPTDDANKNEQIPVADNQDTTVKLNEVSEYIPKISDTKIESTPEAKVTQPAVLPEPTPVAETETIAPIEIEDIAAFSLEGDNRSGDDSRISAAPTEDPYEISTGGKRSRYAIASGMQYPLDEKGEPITDYFEKNVQEYSIYSDTLIMISADDYEKAMNIIWKHISGSYASYYFVSIPSYDVMVSELNDAGIRFEANMSAVTDTITFRVITY